MSYTVTTLLGLQKAVAGSGQQFEIPVLNSNWDKIDAQFVSDQASFASLRKGVPTVTDLAALQALAGMTAGDTRIVQEGGALFEYQGAAWGQQTFATFATTAARDTAYAKASSAYLVNGAQARTLDTGVTMTYRTAYNSGSNPAGFGSAAAWYTAQPGAEYAVPNLAVGAGALTTVTGTPTLTAGTSDGAGASIATPIAGGLTIVTPGRYAIEFKGGISGNSGRGFGQITLPGGESIRGSGSSDDNFNSVFTGYVAAGTLSLAVLSASATTASGMVLRLIYLGAKQ